MRSTVISDFGGVLTTPLIHGLNAFAQESGTSLEEVAAAMGRVDERTGVHPLYALERGEVSEREFLSRIEAELDGGVRLRGLSQSYFAHLEPNRRMIDFLAGLRGRGLRLAICTNNVREWEAHWRALLPELDDIFEAVVDSAFVGTRKPEPEIYRIVLERMGVEGRHCVFLDDLEVNCEAAERAGMVAVHFRSNEQAIPELEAALSG